MTGLILLERSGIVNGLFFLEKLISLKPLSG